MRVGHTGIVAPRCAAWLALVLFGVPALAAAQREPAGGMDFPDRAGALRPTGAVTLRGSWVRRFAPAGVVWDDDEIIHGDFTMQELEARVPIGGLLLEAVFGSTQRIYSRHAGPDRGVWLYPNAPQLGGYFIDAPDPHWRYELGGAIAVGIDEEVTADDACVRIGTSCARPVTLLDDTGAETLGWDAHRRTRDAVIGIPRARVEWSPISPLLLGAELELPIYAFYDGRGAEVFPQGAVEAAYRFLGASLVGLRTRVTSRAPGARVAPGEVGYYVDVTFEPYARLAFLEPTWGGFVRAAVLLTVGPAYPLVFAPEETGRGPDSGGFLGAMLDVGALY